ncbi:L-2,4-diaminobutyric acid acetyltransferase [Vibrio stylophorae]|uniref:L-2,4-diaminobutyric acid acetyltransferase n=1 Tax=Vibrio stylophorae TaxID=659351 RepID=A0ABN8DZ58_9VIBR|nr:diaminobutyrate acetyltransferase [Vibrio stylophorae]CAH0535588.1 L-2,4-diaminobutyric acid acetyltransferase [Vibrio stylophorae]
MRDNLIAAAPWQHYSDILQKDPQSISFRQPKKEDGLAIHQLIAHSPPLDTNSTYCNFLQADHFRHTCIVCEQNCEIAGFISAYRKPEDPTTLFVWQVVVGETVRGLGIGYRMLTELLARDALADIQAIETTITDDNDASWALFRKLEKAHQLGHVSIFLDKENHFQAQHETEFLFRVPLAK